VCRQAVETATGTPVTDEAASRPVRHRVAGCEACRASDAALSRDPAGPVERVPTRGLPSPGLRRVCDFIQDNLNQRLTLMELSTVVTMSLYHFARLFKQSTGVPRTVSCSDSGSRGRRSCSALRDLRSQRSLGWLAFGRPVTSRLRSGA